MAGPYFVKGDVVVDDHGLPLPLSEVAVLLEALIKYAVYSDSKEVLMEFLTQNPHYKDNLDVGWWLEGHDEALKRIQNIVTSVGLENCFALKKKYFGV